MHAWQPVMQESGDFDIRMLQVAATHFHWRQTWTNYIAHSALSSDSCEIHYLNIMADIMEAPLGSSCTPKENFKDAATERPAVEFIGLDSALLANTWTKMSSDKTEGREVILDLVNRYVVGSPTDDYC